MQNSTGENDTFAPVLTQLLYQDIFRTGPVELVGVFRQYQCHFCYLLGEIKLLLLPVSKGTVKPLMEVFHGTATECHLPYGITQCYLLPDTSEHTPP